MLSAETEFGDLQAYDDLCARVYTDPEIPHGTRELVLALGWLNLRDPARHVTDESTTRRLKRLLGRTNTGERRYGMLFAEDAPRYEKPRSWFVGNGWCEGPRIRPYRPRGHRASPNHVHVHEEPERLVCGTRGQVKVPEWDLVTGQLSLVHWFCRRHAAHADRVRDQLAARGEAPAPIPNTGGFLPRYFEEAALIKLYTNHRRGWQPPIYGLCRDDWPTATPTLLPKKPRLALVVGGADLGLREQA